MLEFPYDIPAVNMMITEGEGGAGRPIRGWYRQGRITGSFQKEKNSKIWLNSKGVAEAWELWASHKGLDPVVDMPSAVQNIADSDSVVESGATVTVIASPGLTVKVVYAA
jgi:hypothetical protein